MAGMLKRSSGLDELYPLARILDRVAEALRLMGTMVKSLLIMAFPANFIPYRIAPSHNCLMKISHGMTSISLAS